MVTGARAGGGLRAGRGTSLEGSEGLHPGCGAGGRGEGTVRPLGVRTWLGVGWPGRARVFGCSSSTRWQFSRVTHCI